VQDGRVLVGSTHGVRALDPETGAEAWHYTRSNARMCGLTVTNGVAVAVFATEDRCDEAVALDADTGVRQWTRSLQLRGDAELDSTDRIVLATSPTGVLTLDPIGDNIRWRYLAPAGCRLLGAEAGSTGVAVLQSCRGAATPQLRLFDGFDGTPKWTRDVPVASVDDLRLLGADGLLTLRADDEVRVLAPADGAQLTGLPIASPDDEVETGTATTVLPVRVGGTLTALDPSSAAVLWTAPATGLPAAPAASEKEAREPAVLLVPDEAGFSLRDPSTGSELARASADGVPSGGLAERVGPVIVLRLADRVLAYR
jgi:outer membrane protein assembly factor BamB